MEPITTISWPENTGQRLSSATIIAGNEDLLTEILVRTPPKTLLRFKSVSKHWLSLISTQQFSIFHTLQTTKPCTPAGLFLRMSAGFESEFKFVSLKGPSHGSPFKSLKFVQDPTGIKIMQSCNGLLLCSNYHRTVGECQNYYVFNPTTKHYKVLNLPENEPRNVLGITLAFDPSKSPHYKVVCVRCTAANIYSYRVDIYDSKTNSWRLCGTEITSQEHYYTVICEGVYWKGAIHWIRPSGDLMYFDVEKECFGTITGIPISGHNEWRRYRHFGESNGHLHFIEVCAAHAMQIHIFEIEGDYSHWHLRYRVDVDEIVAAFPEIVRSDLDTRDMNYYAFCVLAFVREDIEEESRLVLHVPGKVVSYNFKEKSFKEMLHLAIDEVDRRGSLQFRCFDAYSYIESLALC